MQDELRRPGATYILALLRSHAVHVVTLLTTTLSLKSLHASGFKTCGGSLVAKID
jgi:hypothetical protein